MPEESYSNPLAPPDHHEDVGMSKISAADRHPLTNADFRKLLQTPRVTSSSAAAGSGSHHHKTNETPSSFSHHRNAGAAPGATDSSGKKSITNNKKGGSGQKKGHFQKKPEDEDELSEIMKKYRDRARERRVGEVQETQQEIDLIQSSGYRAVAPDIKANLDLAEKRKRIIEESKYLGGDMEHTHLVKGLDYALLQKVRSEIVSKEKEEDTLEETYQARKTEREEVESQLKSVLSRNIYSILFKNEHPILNELFAPRRMAYVIELDDEYAETDIPTTLIRSKQDCPVDETSTNLSINDMVIQKLTQVLSYLRTDTKKKRKGKEKIPETERVKVASQNIYDDTGDYVPTVNRNSNVNRSGESSKNSRQYFDKPSNVDDQDKRYDKKSSRSSDNRYDNERANRRDKEKDSGTSREHRDRGDNRDSSSYHQKHRSLDKNNNQKQREDVQQQKSTSDKQPSKFEDLGSYAECYPGGYECYDAAGDSDDDADFSKMDLGNRKGPIRRWDFETEQEYEEYMSRREALPKAAFQYGVKMHDGRKTRKLPGGQKNERDDKAKIDRQWAKISQILSKRKENEGDDRNAEPSKKMKY